MKSKFFIYSVIFAVCSLMGCRSITKTQEGHVPVKYEIVEEADIPDDMKEEIEQKKEKPFRIVYREPEALYIGEGYGKKDCRGYCVEWVECAVAEEALYIETTLHGPGGDGVACESEYAYSVIKMEENGKPIMFVD